MDTVRSACPHDCPSTCSLEIERIDRRTIGRVRGSKANTYTAGVICEKVARYAERAHHPDRLTRPLLKRGGGWIDIDWGDALDLTAERFLAAEAKHGAETVWPYFYAGTMGLVQRDSIQRLRHAKGYSGQFDSVCVNLAWTGFAAATGALRGPDPREMAVSDCVIIWGTNPVNTQINVMTHAARAKRGGGKIVVVDVYETGTMKQADLGLVLRPGTDGALACAVMHGLFRDGRADREWMERYAKDGDRLEAHLQTRTPEWASAITGLPVSDIEAFIAILGERPRSYFRLGYGFTRSRNGAVNMHAAASIASVMGAWKHEGGGAFHSNSGIFGLDGSLIQGDRFRDPNVRYIDQSQIGRALTGDPEALAGGPPVTAMLIQNTNPMSIAPEQNRVREGFARDDLFTVVHEQFMTETAAVADLVLPATMFVEHEDLYKGGGNSHVVHGPKIVDAPEGCRTNLFVIDELAKRLGASGEGFGHTERELIDDMLARSGRPVVDDWEVEAVLDVQPPFATAHYVDGFGHADGRFHFAPDWKNVPWGKPPMGLLGPSDMPELPDHWAVTDRADERHPFRLATSPARTFLNSTFTETPGSARREGRPEARMHPDDLAALGVADGDAIALRNDRGRVRLHARAFEGVRPGVIVVEGIHGNAAHADGIGINALTSADQSAPHGGAAFHDTAVRVERL